jgi:hypothetical protein
MNLLLFASFAAALGFANLLHAYAGPGRLAGHPDAVMICAAASALVMSVIVRFARRGSSVPALSAPLTTVFGVAAALLFANRLFFAGSLVLALAFVGWGVVAEFGTPGGIERSPYPRRIIAQAGIAVCIPAAAFVAADWFGAIAAYPVALGLGLAGMLIHRVPLPAPARA